MTSIDDVCKGEIDLPVIDLSVLNSSDLQAKAANKAMITSSPLLELISKIRDACQGTACFHVVNHGVEEPVIEGVVSAAREVLGVSTEAKERLASMVPWYDFMKRTESQYLESLNFRDVMASDATQKISGHVWPSSGNPRFCKEVLEYSSKMHALSKTLMKLIVLSLGFDMESEYYEPFFEKSCETTLRFSSYARPTNLETPMMALPSHEDISFLSFLYHDIIGGLQVQTEGDWFRIKPVSNSTGSPFVVFLGDALEIWSNCRYRSTPHRVADEGWSNRLTVAFFLACKEDTALYAPDQLVDEDHPRRYVPLVFKDYRIYMSKFKYSRKNVAESNTRPPFLVPSPTPQLS